MAHTEGATAGADIPFETWQRVLVVLERLALSRDLHEVLQLIIDSLRDCLRADRASVFQYERHTHELFASRAHGVDHNLRFSADAGIAGEAVRTGRIINVPDCYADARFNPTIDKQTGYRTRCMLTIPLLSFGGDLEGVAQVLNKNAAGGAFDELDETVARALASQAAVAIRRATLIEAELRKNKIEADLRVAREMQQASLPDCIPMVPGFDLTGRTIPADETGGDTFDITPMGQPGAPAAASDAGVLLFMADATGHGVGPALSVSRLHAMLRLGARLRMPVESLIAALNAQMCEDLPPGRFITAFVGVLDAAAGRIRSVSAGQAPLLIVRAHGGNEVLAADVLPMGIDPGLSIESAREIDLAPGDLFAVLSDGIYEAAAPGGEQFGVERVAALIRAIIDRSAEEIADAIFQAADEFTQGLPPDDDRTAVIVRRPLLF